MPRNIKSTLEQWRVLQAVVEQGGFAQAAEYLHRSQSSVSYAVAKLQEQLGVELLVQEGRKARLTEQGEALLARAELLLEEALSMEAYARSLTSGWEAEVRLVFDSAYPSSLLVPALRAFATRYPQVRVLATEEVLSGTLEAIDEERADVVIAHKVPAGLLGQPLAHVDFVAMAHPDHPLHSLQRPLSAVDLKRHTQIVIADTGQQHKEDKGWLGAGNRITVSSIDKAIQFVSSGLGFAWLPVQQVEQLGVQGRLKALPLKEGGGYMASLFLIYPMGEEAGPASRALGELLLNP